MNKKMKQLDKIHVNEEYKSEVYSKVKNKKGSMWTMKKSLLSFATVILVILIAFRGFQASTIPVKAIVSSVAMDINPSIILNLDSDNIVIEVVTSDSDAQSIINDIDIINSDFIDVMNEIMDSPQMQLYLEEEFLEVSIYSEYPDLAKTIDEQVDVILNNKVKNGNCHSEFVDREVWEQAQKMNMSVGKYKLIQDIQKLDKLENYYGEINLNNYTMKELRNMYNQCMNGDGQHQNMKDDNFEGSRHHRGKGK